MWQPASTAIADEQVANPAVSAAFLFAFAHPPRHSFHLTSDVSLFSGADPNEPNDITHATALHLATQVLACRIKNELQ
jgi:hypothetical protein